MNTINCKIVILGLSMFRFDHLFYFYIYFPLRYQYVDICYICSFAFFIIFIFVISLVTATSEELATYTYPWMETTHNILRCILINIQIGTQGCFKTSKRFISHFFFFISPLLFEESKTSDNCTEGERDGGTVRSLQKTIKKNRIMNNRTWCWWC